MGKEKGKVGRINEREWRIYNVQQRREKETKKRIGENDQQDEREERNILKKKEEIGENEWQDKRGEKEIEKEKERRERR